MFQFFMEVSVIVEEYGNLTKVFFDKKVSKKSARLKYLSNNSYSQDIVICSTLQKYFFSVDYTNICYHVFLKH